MGRASAAATDCSSSTAAPISSGAQRSDGYWRVGYDNMSGWPSNGTNAYFAGSMRYASVFSTVLTPTQVAQHYGAGSGS